MKGYKPDLTKCVVCGETQRERLHWWLIRGWARFSVCAPPSLCFVRVAAAERAAKGSLTKLLNELIQL